jgi:hypothetical protein
VFFNAPHLFNEISNIRHVFGPPLGVRLSRLQTRARKRDQHNLQHSETDTNSASFISSLVNSLTASPRFPLEAAVYSDFFELRFADVVVDWTVSIVGLLADTPEGSGPPPLASPSSV